MKSFQEIRDQSNRTVVNLLFTDAEIAMNMLDLARVSEMPELRKRRLREALRAYNFIRKHTPAVALTREEATALNKKMSLLKLRLSLA